MDMEVDTDFSPLSLSMTVTLALFFFKPLDLMRLGREADISHLVQDADSPPALPIGGAISGRGPCALRQGR